MESKRHSKTEKKYSIRQDIEVEAETSPLYNIAVKKGDEHLVNALLAKGASLTIEDDFKYTPIDLAASYGHQRISFIFNIWRYKSIYDQYPTLTKKRKWN